MSLNNSVLTDFAYSEILNMILSAEIKPGARIREDLLAEKLGISRTPVREAVNRLTQNGFIINIKRKGVYCVQVTRKDLLNLIDLRNVLESLSFEKCIELASDEDLASFQDTIDEFHHKFNKILRNNSPMAGREISLLHNEYDVRFHIGIAEISGSTHLVKYINEVESLLLIARQRIYRNEEGTNIVLLSWKQHELMLESIRKRDKTAAKEMLTQHLQLMCDTQVNIEAEETKPSYEEHYQ